MPDDTRRAPATFRYAAGSQPPLQGEADATCDDDGLTVGAVRIEWLDADTVIAANYHLAIDCWPAGRLELSQLGRRFDSFCAALARARNQARVAGLQAHAPTMPEVFSGALLGGDAPRPAELQVYPTHVTIVPEDADPFQVPHGALTGIATSDVPPAIVLVTPAGRTIVGQLARRRDAFLTAVTRERDAQAQLLAAYAGQPGFADGRAVPRGAINDFDALLERCCAAERLDGARALLAAAKGGEPHLGFVQLLDPEGGLAAADPLPKDWASFLLVPSGGRVALEILAGPGAATYVFDGTIAAVNADLQLLHFRRAGLALSAEQAAVTPDNPHRLALRRLAPLQRLRAATRSRLIHGAHWSDALAEALAGG